MTTGKTIAFTRWTLVNKVMSLLFNMLSRQVIASLPSSKCLLISWLQSISAMILEPKKIKSVNVSTVSPSLCHEVMGPDVMIFIFFWILSFKPADFLPSQSLWFSKRVSTQAGPPTFFFPNWHVVIWVKIGDFSNDAILPFRQSWNKMKSMKKTCFAFFCLNLPRQAPKPSG